VIGMNQAIRDDAAIAFSIGFYRALGYGKSVEDAFKFGKNAIQLAIGDDPKTREAIAEEMRKLIAVGEVSEAIIEEHLKPVLKVNPDIILPEPLQKTPIVSEFDQIQLQELKEDIDSLFENYQLTSKKARYMNDPADKNNLKRQAQYILEQIKEKEIELRNLEG
ncbi:MAG: hypothetical protein WBM44_28065, partial [Waterburya sp.]